MNANNDGKVRFSIDKTGFFAESAMILLILSAIFRIIGCWGLWTDRVYALMLILLPVCCCLLLALCILLFGKKGFFLSFIPVLLGVVFFVFKSLYFDNWIHTVLCILLYMVVAVLYTGTVFGWIRTKWLLPPLFALPFLYHVIVEDLPALSNTAQPVTFADGMQEMSVLCIMAAMFCIGIGLKKHVKEPKVIEPEVVEPVPPTEPLPASAPAVQPEAAPAPAEAEPAPAEAEPAPVEAEPAPVEAEPAPAEAEPAPAAPDFDMEEPYHASLTLDPEPWEPEGIDAPEAKEE